MKKVLLGNTGMRITTPPQYSAPCPEFLIRVV
jgi:hypothetical protein